MRPFDAAELGPTTHSKDQPLSPHFGTVRYDAEYGMVINSLANGINTQYKLIAAGKGMARGVFAAKGPKG